MSNDGKDGRGDGEWFKGLGRIRRGQRGGAGDGSPQFSRYFIDYDRDGRYLAFVQEPSGSIRPFGSGSSPRRLVDAALAHAAVGDQIVLSPTVGIVLMAALPLKALETVEAAGVEPFGAVSLVIPKFAPDSFAARIADLRKQLQDAMGPDPDEPAVAPPELKSESSLDCEVQADGDVPPEARSSDEAIQEALQIERWRAEIAKLRPGGAQHRKGGRIGWIFREKPGGPTAE